MSSRHLTGAHLPLPLARHAVRCAWAHYDKGSKQLGDYAVETTGLARQKLIYGLST